MEFRSKWKDDIADAKEVMAGVQGKLESDSSRGDTDYVVEGKGSTHKFREKKINLITLFSHLLGDPPR